MLKQFITPLLLVFGISACFGQIIVNQSDLPAPGDTVRLSMAAGLGSLDPAATGQAYTWDFGSLTPMSQQVDTFINVSATPFLFQLVFNNPTDPNKATHAQLMSTLDVVPGLSLNGVYSFYRSTSSIYSFVGYAGEFNGIPLPAKFSSPDILYKFPMQYGHADSALAILDFSLPGLGAVYIERYRRNYVEGYGTLITPYGENQVLKLRSEITEYDSVYLDTLGQGIAITRIYTEYKWIGKGFDLPLLQITQEGSLQTIAYVDSVRNPSANIPEQTNKRLGLKAFPNPASGDVTLTFNMEWGAYPSIGIFDLMGREIATKKLAYLSPGTHQVVLDQDIFPFSSGNFLIRLSLPEGSSSVMVMRK